MKRMCVQAILKFVALPVPQTIITAVIFSGVARERGPKRSGMVPHEKALVSSYRPPSLPLYMYLCVLAIGPLIAYFVPLNTTFTHHGMTLILSVFAGRTQAASYSQ